MGSDEDVRRSVRRVIAAELGVGWQVRLGRDDLVGDLGDVAALEQGRPTSSAVRVAVPQGGRETVMPLTLTLYPRPTQTDAREQRAGAERLARRLVDLLELGPAAAVRSEAGRAMSGPLRLPLWDYAAVSLTGSGEERRGPEHPTDVLWVLSASGQAIRDEDDPRRFTVTVDLRVAWTAPGRDPDPAPIAESMPGTFVP